MNRSWHRNSHETISLLRKQIRPQGIPMNWHECIVHSNWMALHFQLTNCFFLNLSQSKQQNTCTAKVKRRRFCRKFCVHDGIENEKRFHKTIALCTCMALSIAIYKCLDFILNATKPFFEWEHFIIILIYELSMHNAQECNLFWIR